MKKFKILFALLAVFLLVFTTTVSASAAESPIENEIQTEVRNYVAEGKLEDWHLEMMVWDGYVCVYNKMVKFSDDFEYFASSPEDRMWPLVTWYQNNWDETWTYIMDNLDIWPEHLEQNKILGIYWDSYFSGLEDEGYLYLVWVSHYTPSEFVNILEFTESGKTYYLYDNEEAAKELDSNWFISDEFHFSSADLTLHITPIGGISDGEPFGIPLKRNYSFEKFAYGIDDAQWGREVDPTNKFGGKVEDKVKFDLGVVPKQDGNNILQLVTHGYEIIEDCEAQSFYELNFGGYKHEVYFNLNVDVDKIYRVDVSYKVTNQDKEVWEFWKPDDEHQVTKSLTSEKSQGGFLGLSSYQGFKQGNYKSTKTDKSYKYKLHLNYDDQAWRIFRGGDLNESNYERISNFQILRINFLVDNETYDIEVKMDTIEGETLNIFSPDLIMDSDSLNYKVKNSIYDFWDKMTSKIKENGHWFWVILGGVVLIFIIVIVIKVARKITTILSIIPDRKDKNKNHKRE